MSENSKPKKKQDVYSIVTDRIIKQLEQGVIPWRKSFAEAGLPKNLVTGRPYRAINVWLLNMLGLPLNFFLTPKQLKELGGVVKEGEKGAPVTFWNWKEVVDEDSGEIKNVPFLKYYLVHGVDQITGLPDESYPSLYGKDLDSVQACENLIEGMPQKPMIKHKEKQASYNPLLDLLNIPKEDAFKDKESFYKAFLHQLVHSTGHLLRLNRKEVLQMSEFGSEPYSIEELIADMGSSYLMSLCGFKGDLKSNDSTDIEGWLQKLKADKQFVIYASSKAQLAADYILNVKEKVAEPVSEAPTDDLPF